MLRIINEEKEWSSVYKRWLNETSDDSQVSYVKLSNLYHIKQK